MKKLLNLKTRNYFIFAFLVAFFIVAVYFISKSFPTEYIYDDLQFKEYSATSPYADVTFKGNDKVLYVTVKYKNLKGVSALHIHVNKNGSPGPVLAWLGTTKEWQRGVAQTAKNGNAPCCTKNNPDCILASPENIGTPYLTEIMTNTERTFVIHNECGKSGKCPWIKNGTLLDIHGFNFQENIDGQLTDKKPGADIIYQAKFIQTSP
jgi:hypothetical protein